MVRRLILSVAGTALALSASTAPAAGVNGDTTIFNLQGLPGRTIDVCVGAREVLSDFKYGRSNRASLLPGTYRVRVFRSDPRTCRGTKLTERMITFQPGGNMTLVHRLIKGAPGIQPFDNLIQLQSVDVASVTVRHAAKAKAVDVWFMQTVKVAADGLGPTVEGLKKGQQAGPFLAFERTSLFIFGPAPSLGLSKDIVAGKAYQLYLIGTKAGNYRLKFIAQNGVALETQ